MTSAAMSLILERFESGMPKPSIDLKTTAFGLVYNSF